VVLLPSETNNEDILRGKTLKVYSLIVRSNEPARVREIQRSLGFSSPSLALYHLEKLKAAGLIKEEGMGYVADKVILKNLIRFRTMLIPRYFFYSLFFSLGAVLELTFLCPPIVTREYLVAVIFTFAAAVGFAVETALHWRGI
jgi:DNA-binding transcriptional ArsR family regulator